MTTDGFVVVREYITRHNEVAYEAMKKGLKAEYLTKNDYFRAADVEVGYEWHKLIYGKPTSHAHIQADAFLDLVIEVGKRIQAIADQLGIEVDLDKREYTEGEFTLYVLDTVEKDKAVLLQLYRSMVK